MASLGGPRLAGYLPGRDRPLTGGVRENAHFHLQHRCIFSNVFRISSLTSIPPFTINIVNDRFIKYRRIARDAPHTSCKQKTPASCMTCVTLGDTPSPADRVAYVFTPWATDVNVPHAQTIVAIVMNSSKSNQTRSRYTAQN